MEPIDDRTAAVDWEVTDPGADLENLRFEMMTVGDDIGYIVDRIRVDLSGETGSGRTLLFDTLDATAEEYQIVLTVFTGTDGRRGKAAEAVELQSEEGGDDDDEGDDDEEETGPVIDQFDVTDRSNSAWDRVDVDWATSHPDGELESVTSELLSSFGGDVLDSETTDVSGAEAAGSHSVRSIDLANEVRLSVVDTDGVKTEETTEF